MRSPLIIGGEMTGFDDFTLKLVTNENILKMHKDARHSHQVWRKEIDASEYVLWTAVSREGQYAAIFNIGESKGKISIPLSDLEIDESVSALELWTGETAQFDSEITVELEPHATKVFLLK